MKFVSYLRVSTTRQGVSGLGLEAQRKAVADFVAGRGAVLSEFVEVESGKVAVRPELEKALAEAKRAGAVLLIAKLDRLSRNLAFTANLLESGVEVAAGLLGCPGDSHRDSGRRRHIAVRRAHAEYADYVRLSDGAGHHGRRRDCNWREHLRAPPAG